MPRIGVLSVPNLLSATAMDHRIAAQYGQNSAPMYSISGLPACTSGGPEMAVMGFGLFGTEPLPTAVSVAAGTPVTFLTTLAGSGVRADGPADVPVAAWITTKTTTTAITA